jgi:hypothetical protein
MSRSYPKHDRRGRHLARHHPIPPPSLVLTIASLYLCAAVQQRGSGSLAMAPPMKRPSSRLIRRPSLFF